MMVSEPDSGGHRNNSAKPGKKQERQKSFRKKDMQQHVEEAQERVCRELQKYMYSWEDEVRRPNHHSTKIWQMIQRNNTNSENLENDFTEILEKTHLLGWNEATKSIRVWA